MASKQTPTDAFEEHCEDCGTTKPHGVSIELRTESGKEENAEFSREPYRVAECRDCGSASVTRMNDA